MKIGKLIDGKLQAITLIQSGDRLVYNATIEVDGEWVSNPTYEHMELLGYKPVNESEKPELAENEYTVETYIEIESQIVVSYEVKTVENIGGVGYVGVQ